MTLLLVDVGNTRLKWALYDAPSSDAQLLVQGTRFLEHIETLAEDAWADLQAPRWIIGSAVAGDWVRRRVEQQMEHWDVPVSWLVPSQTEAGVINGYDHPARLGADRWAALIGARHRLLQKGIQAPCIVVMVGTAVTIDALDENGRFLGGVILPGHGIMLRALEAGTAGLHVPTGKVLPFPTNTSDALTSGGTFAIAGAIQQMLSHLQQYSQQTPYCIMAGGAGWKVAPSMGVPFELHEHLVFDGLLVLARLRCAAESL